jgi:hypothetical protein
MPGGRPGPALFELLRDKTGSRSEVAARPAPASTPPPAAAAPTPRIAIQPSFDLKQRITISMSAVWIGIGLAILVFVGIYSLVYKTAYSHGERDATRDITKGGGGINEPLHSNSPIAINPNLVSPNTAKQSPASGPAAPTGPTPGSASGDPRVAGFNYLTIASKMDRDTAERAVAFLAENNLKAFAIPVVKAGSGGNNAATYTLYALQGITRDELRAKAPVKTDLEERVTRLGKIWQKEHKGQTDFSRWYWDKFGS